jgi:hypothetical protein
MINKSRMSAMVSMYSSRYHYMFYESVDLHDNANAEVCRIASRAWQTIYQECMNPDYPDFQVERVIVEAREEWDEYTKTGIPEFEPQVMADNVMRLSREQYAKKYGPKPTPAPAVQPVKTESIPQKPVQESPEYNEKGQRIRKASSPKIIEPPTDLPVETEVESDPVPVVEPTPEAVDVPVLSMVDYHGKQISKRALGKLFLEHINNRSIDEVINTINSEFGLDKQELEVANSVSIPSGPTMRVMN